MKRGVWSTLVALFICMAMLWASHAWAEEMDNFPEENIQVPEEAVHQDYLGISDNENFVIGDVQADLVLVQVFSMYCPICQREAPDVNDLYDMIHEQGLEESIKIFGIAPGNSSFEVSVYRDRYEVEFPLIPDPDFVWHKYLGEVGTPTYYAVDPENGRILHSHTGPFRDGVEAYLEEVKAHL